jgi:regulatory protein
MRRFPEQQRPSHPDPADDRIPEKGEDRKTSRRRESTPAQRALGLLVRREHSRQELTRKLQARGIPEEDASAAVDRMSQAGWQDDGRFACSLARTRAAAGYGPLRIRAELSSHGLAGAAVESAFAALAETGDDDWPERARELVRRRHGAPGHLDIASQRKAADFLLRRGFDGDSIRAAIRALPDE